MPVGSVVSVSGRGDIVSQRQADLHRGDPALRYVGCRGCPGLEHSSPTGARHRASGSREDGQGAVVPTGAASGVRRQGLLRSFLARVPGRSPTTMRTSAGCSSTPSRWLVCAAAWRTRTGRRSRPARDGRAAARRRQGRRAGIGTSHRVHRRGPAARSRRAGRPRASEAAIERCTGIDPDVAVRLQHAVLSHHGELEWGSPKKPSTSRRCCCTTPTTSTRRRPGSRACWRAPVRADERWTDASNLFRRPLYAPRAAEDDAGRRADEDEQYHRLTA